MIELLAIWGACFFWAMVFNEMNRKYMQEDFDYYYDNGLSVFLNAIAAPVGFVLEMVSIHKDSA